MCSEKDFQFSLRALEARPPLLKLFWLCGAVAKVEGTMRNIKG